MNVETVYMPHVPSMDLAVYYRDIDYVDEFSIRDATVCMKLVDYLGNRYGEEFKVDYKLLSTMCRIDERSVIRSVSVLKDLKILTSEGNTSAKKYTFIRERIAELAKDSKLKNLLKSHYRSNLNMPIPVNYAEEERKELQKTMLQDVQELKANRTAAAREVKKDNTQKERKERILPDEISRYTDDFLKELSKTCHIKFIGLFPTLKLRLGTEGLYKYIKNVREKANNPHLTDMKQFEEAIDAFKELADSGELKDQHTMQTRNVLLKYFKNVERPKWANCIKGVSNKLADKLATIPGFLEKAKVIFKAQQDFNFKYRNKVWNVYDVNGNPYIPNPYTEGHVYVHHKLYQEKASK